MFLTGDKITDKEFSLWVGGDAAVSPPFSALLMKIYARHLLKSSNFIAFAC